MHYSKEELVDVPHFGEKVVSPYKALEIEDPVVLEQGVGLDLILEGGGKKDTQMTTVAESLGLPTLLGAIGLTRLTAGSWV